MEFKMKNLKSIYKFIVSKEKVFFVFSAGIYLTLLVLHILFYTQADKLVKGIEMVVIPVIVYGCFKLMFESVRKKVYEDSVTYMIAFFCLGAIYCFITNLAENKLKSYVKERWKRQRTPEQECYSGDAC